MYRVRLIRELALIGGERVNLYRAVVDYRMDDMCHWELLVDQSNLFDSVMGAQGAGVELDKLYQSLENDTP